MGEKITKSDAPRKAGLKFEVSYTQHQLVPIVESKGCDWQSQQNPAADTEILNPELSQTEQAYRKFLQRIEQIQGVLGAKRIGGYSEPHNEVVVAVPSLRSKPATLVIRAKFDTIREFPKARLEIRIKGLKERGIELSEFIMADL
jgi:hypothetical protein